MMKLLRFLLLNAIILTSGLFSKNHSLSKVLADEGTSATQECIVYIRKGLPKPGHGYIPDKLVCLSPDRELMLTLLGDANEFFGGDPGSGTKKLFIPKYVISTDNTVDLDDLSTADIKIEGKVGTPRATYTGTFKVLVVRIADSTSSPTYTASAIGDHVFSTTTGQLSMKERFMSCSKNQLIFNPATGTNVTNGVYDVQTTTTITGQSDETCRSAGAAAANAAVAANVIDNDYTFTMIICPSTVDFPFEVGAATFNGYESWYDDVYGSYPAIQGHEIGHNLNFGHSGWWGHGEYDDPVGLMGEAFQWIQTWGKLCFNPAKSYFSGWYPSAAVVPTTTTYSGYISDINSYYQGDITTHPLPVKLSGTGETPLYIMLHQAQGITSDYVNWAADYINKVHVVQQADNDSSGYGQKSWFRAALAGGDTYSQANWAGTGRNLKIEVCNITTGSPDEAFVHIYVEGINTLTCSNATHAPSTSMSPSKSLRPSLAPSLSPSLSLNPSGQPVPGQTTAPSLSQSPSASPSKGPVTTASDPSTTPSMAPSSNPSLSLNPSGAPVTQSPVSAFNCRDSPLRFVPYAWNTKKRSCAWMGRNSTLTADRCSKAKGFKHCPKTCDPTNCSYGCEDSPFHFFLKKNKKRKSCDWVIRKKTVQRCAMTGVKNTCRKTCGRCTT